MTNYIIIEDQKLVQDEICLFYFTFYLYKSKFQKSDCDFLFENIDEDMKKNGCRRQTYTAIEIENALKQMKNGKSPGIDGLTSEFLKHFWADIKKLLYKAFLECIK